MASRILSLDDFSEGFLKSTMMIIVSEIGDKTFFIAALMAMRHSRRVVLAGCLGALVSMTILSVAFGWAAPNLIPKQWTHHAATLLFFFFGIKSIMAGIAPESGAVEKELADVEHMLDKDDADGKLKARSSGLLSFLSPVLVEAFSLTFLGEWGDRSQIATIGLAAQDNVLGVCLGGIIGHALCTGTAVWGGKHIASHISERTVALCGGVLFILFGLHTILFEAVNGVS